MFKSFYLKKHMVIGVDIQADAVRLLKLKQTKRGLSIEQLAFAALPANAIIEGKIKNSLAVSGVIAKLVQATESYGKVAAIALPSQSVITNQIKLTEALSEEECEAEINSNLRHYLPGINEELSFDFYMKNSSEVLVIAARQQQLNDYINVARHAGLDVKIVDCNSYALVRGANFFYPNHQALAVFDINSIQAQFILFQNPSILFNYSIHLDNLEHQIKHIAQLCSTTHQHLRFESIIWSGKKSIEIQEIIERTFQLPIVKATPFLAMDYYSQISQEELKKIEMQMLTCWGLALRVYPYA